MLEYIAFGGLLIVIIGIFLIYQKIGNKDQSNDASQVNLADIQERLGIIENAQENIKILTNGKIVDCLLKFDSATENETIPIDSKFVWNNYEKYKQENDETIKKTLFKEFEKDVNNHIKAISEKYIVTGETAPLALMFVASEGVFREICEISEDFIKEARQKNVIITSPNTMWAFLRTYRMLIQNREMYEQTNVIQKEVSVLAQVINTFNTRFKELETRHGKNSETIEEIKTSVSKITKSSNKIQNLDLDDKSDLDNKKVG